MIPSLHTIKAITVAAADCLLPVHCLMLTAMQAAAATAADPCCGCEAAKLWQHQKQRDQQTRTASRSAQLRRLMLLPRHNERRV